MTGLIMMWYTINEFCQYTSSLDAVTVDYGFLKHIERRTTGIIRLINTGTGAIQISVPKRSSYLFPSV